MGGTNGTGQYRDLHRRLAGDVLRSRPRRRIATEPHESLAGLALFDLILRPDHIDRATETITFTSTVDLSRRFEVDIAGDRLSPSRRKVARSTAEMMMADRSLTNSGGGPLWLPLLTLPRPVSTPVRIYDSAGVEIPRPPQRMVRQMLIWAILHVFAEELTYIADSEAADTAHEVLRNDDEARWMMYSAISEVCMHSSRAPSTFTARSDIASWSVARTNKRPLC